MNGRNYNGYSRCRLGLSAVMSLALLVATCVPAFATAPVLPDTGVDVAAWIPVVITSLGTVVLATVGGYFAFLLIRKGMKWARKAFG